MKYFGKEPPLVDLNDLESWIIFHDENFIAINKPGWLVCHPSKNGDLSSLVGAVRVFLKTEMIHLVNRLDRETSGVVLFAKNKVSASLTQKAMSTRIVKKSYLTILERELRAEVTISQPLGDDKDSQVIVKTRCAIDSSLSKEAITIFTPIESKNNFTLAKVELLTGRKHQIRCHAKWMNHAIVGDKIYGKDETLYLDFIENGFYTGRCISELQMERQALHAYKLDLSSIINCPPFIAPLPSDMREFLNRYEISIPNESHQ